MAQKVADVMWEMLVKAGVKRCYGIVGDALNPVIDALRRNGKIEFIHVRHEEYGVFAAVADAYLSGNPVVVCGTAGPGVMHLFNGLMDARKEGAAVIAIAGDVETSIMDTAALEELNPYKFFDTACLYVGRVVNPEQVRAVVTTAIMTAVVEKGPTVISMPGDIASANAPDHSSHRVTIPAPAGASTRGCGSRQAGRNDRGFEDSGDFRRRWLPRCARRGAGTRDQIEGAGRILVSRETMAGARQSQRRRDDRAAWLRRSLSRPFTMRTWFCCWVPTSRSRNFCRATASRRSRSTGTRNISGGGRDVNLGLVGDIKATVTALLAKVQDKTDIRFLEKFVAETNSFHELLQHYVDKGPGIKPIRPEFLAATLSELASDDAMFFVDTGTACIWSARHMKGGANRRIFGSFSWASMANAGANAFGAQLAFPGRQTIALCGDGGFTMLGLGDLLTQVERKTPVVQIILNNESLDFVNIEMQEAGVVPFGVDFKNPNFAKVAEAMGAKGIRIEDPGDVKEGLAEALAYKGGPVVVDAVVDPYALSLPSHVPFHAAKGFTLSLAKQVLNGKMDEVIQTIEHNVRLV